MNLKQNHYSRRALALLLTLVMCVGMIPTAFAAQQNSYHDPAEHWMQASGRTNELDANSVVTRETFKCGECGKATSFKVFRVPEYTRNGQPALSRNVKYSDGTMVDGIGKGDTMDGIPGKDATYTGYHYTKAVCETCGGINTNMSKSEYGYLKNVYWLYDCAAEFTQKLDETVSYEYTDDTYHTVTTKGGTFCPQNSEYVNTAQLVRQIAREHGGHVALVPGCGWALSLLRHMMPAVDKAFGSLCYDFALSQYPQDYCLWDFAASVRESEH